MSKQGGEEQAVAAAHILRKRPLEFGVQQGHDHVRLQLAVFAAKPEEHPAQPEPCLAERNEPPGDVVEPIGSAAIRLHRDESRTSSPEPLARSPPRPVRAQDRRFEHGRAPLELSEWLEIWLARTGLIDCNESGPLRSTSGTRVPQTRRGGGDT